LQWSERPSRRRLAGRVQARLRINEIPCAVALEDAETQAHATRNASEFERVRGTAPDRHDLVPLAEPIAFIAHDRGHARTPGFWSQNGTPQEDFSPTGEALRR
jgi:hypothetical protein